MTECKVIEDHGDSVKTAFSAFD